MADEGTEQTGIGNEFTCGYHVVGHGQGEYWRGDVCSNTAGNLCAIVERGVNGMVDAPSCRHLHRYGNELDFRWNRRQIIGDQRVKKARMGDEGKCLMCSALEDLLSA